MQSKGSLCPLPYPDRFKEAVEFVHAQHEGKSSCVRAMVLVWLQALTKPLCAGAVQLSQEKQLVLYALEQQATVGGRCSAAELTRLSATGRHDAACRAVSTCQALGLERRGERKARSLVPAQGKALPARRLKPLS